MTSPDPRRLALVICATTSGMMLLDLHKGTIAIPSIEAALRPGPVGLQLILSAYAVSFAVALVPFGVLGDRLRRSTLMVWGLLGYLVFSALAAFAPGIEVLVVARALMGVAAGVLVPQSLGIVQMAFAAASSERAKAFALYGSFVSVATGLGPSLGGLLITLGGPAHGWRWIFGMNLPIGVVLLLGAALVVRQLDPGSPRRRDVAAPRRESSFDWIGLTMLTGGLVCLLLPFILTTGRPDDPPARWLLIAVFAALCVGLVLSTRARMRRGAPTIIDVALLRIASFRNGVLLSLLWFASGAGFSLALGIHLQSGRGLTPFSAGLVLLPSAIGAVVGSQVGGRLVTQWGRGLTLAGMALSMCTMVAVVGLLHLGDDVMAAIAALTFLSGIGGGFVVSPNHTQTLMDVPADKGSSAGSLGQLAQRVSNSLGVAATSMAVYAVVYGTGFSLSTAPRAVHVAALDQATLVALGFLVAAAAVALGDWRRQRAVAAELRL